MKLYTSIINWIIITEKLLWFSDYLLETILLSLAIKGSAMPMSL